MSAVVSVLLLGLALVAVSTFDGSAKPDVLSDLSGSNPAGLTDDEPPAVITVVSWPAFKFPSRLHKQRGHRRRDAYCAAIEPSALQVKALSMLCVSFSGAAPAWPLFPGHGWSASTPH